MFDTVLVAPERRLPELGFGHHQYVAALPPEDTKLLVEAMMSVGERLRPLFEPPFNTPIPS